MLCFEYYILCCSYIGFRHLLLLTGEECGNGRCVTHCHILLPLSHLVYGAGFIRSVAEYQEPLAEADVSSSLLSAVSPWKHTSSGWHLLFTTQSLLSWVFSCFFQDRCQFVIHCNKIDIFLSLFVLFAHYYTTDRNEAIIVEFKTLFVLNNTFITFNGGFHHFSPLRKMIP